MFPDDLTQRAAALVALYRERNLMIATAESCTGGLVAGLITSIPGSSDVFERGFVTYSNLAKVDCLGVAPALLDAFGAVSLEVAEAMAMGALSHSKADVAVSVTGIAGPGGGSPQKPVGLVCFGCAIKGGAVASQENRFGDLGRDQVRIAAVGVALDLLMKACTGVKI
jgi:nicotinamide-nucleotide amidase